ncbi:MAG: hypothetical protein AABW41_01245 [Nanoarchaeota archaeon]
MNLVDILRNENLILHKDWNKGTEFKEASYGFPVGRDAYAHYEGLLDENYRKIVHAVENFLADNPYVLACEVNGALNEIEGVNSRIVHPLIGTSTRLVTPVHSGNESNPYFRKSDKLGFVPLPMALEEAAQKYARDMLPYTIRFGGIKRKLPYNTPHNIQISEDGKCLTKLLNQWNVVFYQERENMLRAVSEDFFKVEQPHLSDPTNPYVKASPIDEPKTRK